MSFSTNTSNVTGKSTTNAFDIVANTLVVTKSELVKGDLTVLGNTNIGNVTLLTASVDYLTVNHLTATNPIPITSGGTGLATIGAPNQVLTVNPSGTALTYQNISLTNPATIIGTGFTGTPTFNFGIEASIGSSGRGFIRTAAATGLYFGNTTENILQLSSNATGQSNVTITNTSANFTYNSTGSSGVFQVQNAGGSISFTNSGLGTISMATAGGAITLADPTSLSGAVSISTAGGIFNLNTGAGVINMTTGAGAINISTGIGGLTGAINITTGTGGINMTVASGGAINIGTSVGAVNIYGSAATIGAPFIYIGIGGPTPIPSAVVFAAGAITGITGLWQLTTAAYELDSATITLNSLAGISLSPTTSVYLNGPTVLTTSVNTALQISSSNASGSISSGYFAITNSASSNPQAAISAYFSGLTAGNTVSFVLGKQASNGDSCYLYYQHQGTANNNNLFGIAFFNQSPFLSATYGGEINLTGNLTVSKNIYTTQNINAGILILNSGNTSLTVDSPKTILIRGGSGSTITLPNATTLIVGFTYEINNNSGQTATIVDFTGSTITTVLSGQLVTVFLLTNPNTAGTWDYHLSGISTNPSFGITTITGSNSLYTSGVLSVINTFTTSAAIATFFSPNLASGSTHFIEYGKSSSTGQSAAFGYAYNSTAAQCETNWTFAGQAYPKVSMLNDNRTVTVNSYLTVVNPTATLNTAVSSFKITSLASGSESYLLIGKDSTDLAEIGFNYNSGNTNLSSAYLRVVSSSYKISINYQGDISFVGNTSTTGTSSSTASISSFSTGVLNVTNTYASSAGIVTFLSPNLTSGAGHYITFGKAAAVGQSAGLAYLYNSTLSSAQIQLSFYGSGNPSLTLTNNGTIQLTSSTMTTTQMVSVDSSNNLVTRPGGSWTFYNASANISVPDNSWTDVANIIVNTTFGNNPLVWTPPPTVAGFKNNSGDNMLVTISFMAQRNASVLGATSVRIVKQIGIELATQDVSALDRVTVFANCYLANGELVQCQIYQNSGSTQLYSNIRITINTYPCPS